MSAINNEVRYTISLADLISGKLENIHGSANEVENGLEGIQKKAGEVAIALGIAFSVEKVKEFGMEILHVTAEYEGFTNVIKYASEDQADGAKNLGYLNDAITRLHLPMQQAYQSFSEMEGGFYGTGIEGEKLRKVFEGISTAGSVLHLMPEQFSHVTFALKEIGELGTLQTRQMRMLAFALPGAMNLAAQSMHLSTAQFHEAMEKGKISSAQFLMNFSAKLKEHFEGGLANAGNSLIAQMNDVQTHFTKLMLEMGDDLRPVYVSIMKGLISVVEDAKEMWHWMVEHKEIIEVVAKAAGALTAAYVAYNIAQGVMNKVTAIGNALRLAQAASFYDVSVKEMGAALAAGTFTEAEIAAAAAESDLTVAQMALNTAMELNPVGLLIAGLTALAGVAFMTSDSTDSVKQSYEELHSVAKESEDINKKANDEKAVRLAQLQTELDMVKNYKSISENTTNSEVARNQALDQAKEHWANLIHLGGAFTSNLSDTRIEIDKAIGDMNDFGDAIYSAALQMGAMNVMAGNVSDSIKKQFEIQKNQESARVIGKADLSSPERLRQIFELYGIKEGSAEAGIARQDLTYKDSGHTKQGDAFQTGLEMMTQDLQKYYAKAANDENKAIGTIAAAAGTQLGGLSKGKQSTAKGPETLTGGLGAGGEAGLLPGKETKGATGNKSTTINIKIENVVKEFSVHSSTIHESEGQVKEKMAEVLKSVVYNSQRVAGD